MFYSKNFDDKVNFVFSAYDLDKDGFLSFTELMQLLKVRGTTQDWKKRVLMWGEGDGEVLRMVLGSRQRNGEASQKRRGGGMVSGMQATPPPPKKKKKKKKKKKNFGAIL